MKKRWKVLLSIMGILSGGAALLSIMFLFLTKGRGEAATSIAIIGGADGPTSIFLAGKVGSGLPLYALTVILAVIFLLLFLVYRKK